MCISDSSLPLFAYVYFWLVWPALEQRILIRFDDGDMALGVEANEMFEDSVCECRYCGSFIICYYTLPLILTGVTGTWERGVSLSCGLQYSNILLNLNGKISCGCVCWKFLIIQYLTVKILSSVSEQNLEICDFGSVICYENHWTKINTQLPLPPLHPALSPISNPPNHLIICFPWEKRRPLMDVNKTHCVKVQHD